MVQWFLLEVHKKLVLFINPTLEVMFSKSKARREGIHGTSIHIDETLHLDIVVLEKIT